MTSSVPRTSAIALGVAALVSLSTLSAARADSSSPAPTPSVPATAQSSAPTTATAAHSLRNPAPTPGWAEAGPNGPTAAHRPPPKLASNAVAPSLHEPATMPGSAESGPARTIHHHWIHHYAQHHYAYRDERRSDNPVATTAMRVAGGAADLGSVAAYPFYCFPNYGSCSVRVPYRY
jgi:hypothetical protein